MTTAAAVEARVERLEMQVNSMSTDIALIKQSQGSLAALVTAQHTSLVVQLTSISTDFRNFEQTTTAQNAEPQATPAGRALLAALTERDGDIAGAKKTADAALLWTIRATGALVAIMAVLTILAPSIRGWLGFA